jgi:hypothetical protein
MLTQPRPRGLVRIILRKIRLALPTTIIARKDTLSGSVVAYIRNRNLS